VAPARRLSGASSLLAPGSGPVNRFPAQGAPRTPLRGQGRERNSTPSRSDLSVWFTPSARRGRSRRRRTPGPRLQPVPIEVERGTRAMCGSMNERPAPRTSGGGRGVARNTSRTAKTAGREPRRSRRTTCLARASGAPPRPSRSAAQFAAASGEDRRLIWGTRPPHTRRNSSPRAKGEPGEGGPTARATPPHLATAVARGRDRLNARAIFLRDSWRYGSPLRGGNR
jgi:hypothetical protein